MIAPIDLHSHTARCNHAVGTMDEYILQAKRMGVHEFGFSDHSWWMLHYINSSEMAMQANEFESYLEDVSRLQSAHNTDNFKIRLGMEMDFIPSRFKVMRQTAQDVSWDYLIGAVHNVGLGSVFDQDVYRKFGIDTVCEFYFYAIAELIQSECVDIIAHLDLPKKFGFKPSRSLLCWIEPLIPLMKEARIAVEINTSGYDSLANECLPGWEIIELLAQEGIMLTLGSDAHAPNQIGRYFELVMQKLAFLGINKLVGFEQRQPIIYPISDYSLELDATGK